MATYPPAAEERAMTMKQVILKAMAGELSWIAAAEILGRSPRSLRRWRQRWQQHGFSGLYDRRRHLPSPKRVPAAELERVLRLYRKDYPQFNVSHFVETVRRDHAVTFSYSLIKRALQEAGLVAKRRARGRHRLRRPRRARFGEMLHLDGSKHQWLALQPGCHQVLVQVLDDATGRLLYAQLWPGETAEAVMSALYEVIQRHGLPMALYTDRAGWAFHTPRKGGKVDKDKLTQVGRALAELGIEHIPSYSPQGRGRSERANGTLQGRLINELRVAKARTLDSANRFLRETFLERFNNRFAHTPQEQASAFIPLAGVDLDRYLCFVHTRCVAGDNTVVVGGVRLQIAKQPTRVSCVGLRVTARRHLDGTHTLWHGTRLLGRYDHRGQALPRPLAHAA